MNRARTKIAWYRAALLLGVLAVAAGCSTDSPTAPEQQPAPPPGSNPPSAQWSITVSSTPGELVAGSTEPATVTVRVRRADNGNAPPTGTTIVLQTSLGDFETLASGIQSLALALANGRAQVLLFPSTVTGQALLTAQLETSIGQATLRMVAAIEPVVASFATTNSGSDLSVAFRNTSTGDPTRFFWEFGDGETSTEENPTHIFPSSGDWTVVLEASKQGSSDRTSQTISIAEQPEEGLTASFDATANGLTVTFRDTSTGDPTSFRWDFGDGSTSSARNPTHTYAADGSYVVSLRVFNQVAEDTTSQTVTVSDAPEDLFISLITPDSGPASGGTSVAIDGSGFSSPLRVFFGAKLATVTSVTSTQLIVSTPSGDLETQECDDDMDTIVGLRSLDTAVTVRVDLESGDSGSIPGGFTYLSPSTACVGD